MIIFLPPLKFSKGGKYNYFNIDHYHETYYEKVYLSEN